MSKINSNQHRVELVYSKKAHDKFSRKCAKMRISLNERIRQLIAADINVKKVERG